MFYRYIFDKKVVNKKIKKNLEATAEVPAVKKTLLMFQKI